MPSYQRHNFGCWYCYICVLILLCMCPSTRVLHSILRDKLTGWRLEEELQFCLHIPSFLTRDSHNVSHTTIYVLYIYYICVLIPPYVYWKPVLALWHQTHNPRTPCVCLLFLSFFAFPFFPPATYQMLSSLLNWITEPKEEVPEIQVYILRPHTIVA